MDKNGYIKNIYFHCEELGFKILKHEPFLIDNEVLNPAEVILVEKESSEPANAHFSCSVTKTLLERNGNVMFSLDSLLSYPIVDEVPMLTIDNAIVTTKMSSGKFM